MGGGGLGGFVGTVPSRPAMPGCVCTSAAAWRLAPLAVRALLRSRPQGPSPWLNFCSPPQVPDIEGVVVCTEFEEAVRAAYEEEQRWVPLGCPSPSALTGLALCLPAV